MKNKDVAINFIQGRNAIGSNFKSQDGKLYSYTSLMAEWKNGAITVYMDIANYSNTSKRHWYYLRVEAPENILVRQETKRI